MRSANSVVLHAAKILRAGVFLVLPCMYACGALAAGLNDTGQSTCYDNSAADSVAADSPTSIARDAGSHPRQDCRYGRDAAAAAGVLTKTGGGAAGFDFTKIANNGSVLAAGASLGGGAADWACTRDNVTGLTWEVKLPDGGAGTVFRGTRENFSWYSSNASTNGGNAGWETAGICNHMGACDTEKYVADVNAATLCGYNDWRLPSMRELGTIIYFDVAPAIDTTYFPNMQLSGYWSATTFMGNPVRAWRVTFTDGEATNYPKGGTIFVSLVRGNLF